MSGSARAWGCDSPGLLTHRYPNVPVPRVNCPGARHQTDRDPLGARGQQLHAAVRAANPGAPEMPVPAAVWHRGKSQD